MYKKGTTPAHSEREYEANAKSINNMIGLLEAVIEDPERAPRQFVDSWHDQTLFAAVSLLEHGIVPMSLNTWKRHAKKQLGDWRKLDQYRKRARRTYLGHMKKKNTPSRGSRADLQARLRDAKDEAQRYINEIAQFAEQYKSLLTICQFYAMRDQNFAKNLETHRKRYARHPTGLKIIKGGRDDRRPVVEEN